MRKEVCQLVKRRAEHLCKNKYDLSCGELKILRILTNGWQCQLLCVKFLRTGRLLLPNGALLQFASILNATKHRMT